MFSEKLLHLLLSFSKYELNRFKKYLVSPYLNDQPDLTRLFDLCNETIRESPEAVRELTKNKVWTQLFGSKKYDDAQLRRLASDLTQLGLKFKMAEKRAADPLPELLEMQTALDQPQLEKHLAGVERHLSKTLETSGKKNVKYYLTNFQMHWQICRRASRVVASSEYLKHLHSMDFYLECFYLIQKLQNYVSWLVSRGFRTVEQDLGLMPGFLEYARLEKFSEVPLISIYLKVVPCLIETDNEPFFRDLMVDLERFEEELAAEDLRELYHHAQNFCALKINQGRVEYYREVFQIFKKLIQRRLLLDEENQLPEGVFKNIITVSQRLGELDWAENFIEENAQFLPSANRENAKTYNLANIFLQKKQHDKVIRLLRDVEYKDVTYSAGSKLALLMTYFEMQEMQVLDAQMDSFRIFIRRNKSLSKNAKREFNNFLIFLKKLAHLAPRDRAAAEKLEKKIIENQSVSAKKWLLEKVAAAKK